MQDINAERERIRKAINEAITKVEDATDSFFWSYIGEYRLGKLDTAKKILEEVEKGITPAELDLTEPVTPLTPSQIIEAVAGFYGFTTPTITGRSKKERCVLARQVAMYLIRQETVCTLAQIGQEMGGRFPATISYAYGKIANRLNGNGALRVEVRSIQNRLLNNREARS